MEMNPTLTALVQTILFTESDIYGEPLEDNYSIADFDEESLKKLYSEYQQFIAIAEEKITEKIGENWDCIDDFYDVQQPALNQTEHDYVLTRNRHGAGFWDGDWSSEVSKILTDAARSQYEFTAYVGDDERIYLV
ncbi:MAG: hypothetical protein EBY66_00670 [Candidatus Fonsibacter lacus]|jgi:hypothetical protein|nr:hypothetical protein [Candidatus Fonsibacter lacus]